MALFLLRFWPVLLPLALYTLWHYAQRHRARRKGEAPPRFRDGPLYWLVLATLLMAVAGFMLLWHEVGGTKGTYLPPHMEGNTLIPAQVKP